MLEKLATKIVGWVYLWTIANMVYKAIYFTTPFGVKALVLAAPHPVIMGALTAYWEPRFNILATQQAVGIEEFADMVSPEWEMEDYGLGFVLWGLPTGEEGDLVPLHYNI